jgi:hypothetical protein
MPSIFPLGLKLSTKITWRRVDKSHINRTTSVFSWSTDHSGLVSDGVGTVVSDFEDRGSRTCSMVEDLTEGCGRG